MNTGNPKSEYLVDGKYGILDLLDLDQLRTIFEMFTKATGFTIGFLDHPNLNVLIATGWRDICTVFHRGCPAADEICIKSNQHLLNNLNEPRQILIEECEHGLVDCATPIIIKGKHIASLATGQMLMVEPDLERFKKQADNFGFDETKYLESLKEIPVVSKEKLENITALLGEIAIIISEMGYANLMAKKEAEILANEIAERKKIELRLAAEREQLLVTLRSIGDGVITTDIDGNITLMNTVAEKLTGWSLAESIEKPLSAIFKIINEHTHECCLTCNINCTL